MIKKLAHVPKWLLPLADILLVALAFMAAYYLRYELQLFIEVEEANYAPFTPYIPYMLVFIGWIALTYHAGHLYDERKGRPFLDEVFQIANGATSATVVVMALSFALRPLVFSRLLLLEAGGLSVIFLTLLRVAQRALRAHLRSKGIGVERVLIVGAGDVGRAVMRTIMARRDLGYVCVGFVDDDPSKGNTDLGRVKALGGLENIPKVIQREGVDLVIITLPWMYHRKILNIVRQCEREHVEARIVPDVFQLSLSRVQVEMLDGVPLLGLRGDRRMNPTRLLAKRALDLTLIFLIAPIALLLMAVVAVAVKLDSPGPVLFRQKRVGLNGREFEILKFRSMVKDAEKQKAALMKLNEASGPLFKIHNDPRVTRVGKIIRRLSLDELPQLINVIRGEMSLVGPRPGTPEEVAQYEPWQMQRLEAPPGITGLWQVSGRSDVPFEEMCLLDIYYIENWSLGLDLQILARTVPHVLFGDGAY